MKTTNLSIQVHDLNFSDIQVPKIKNGRVSTITRTFSLTNNGSLPIYPYITITESSFDSQNSQEWFYNRSGNGLTTQISTSKSIFNGSTTSLYDGIFPGIHPLWNESTGILPPHTTWYYTITFSNLSNNASSKINFQVTFTGQQVQK